MNKLVTVFRINGRIIKLPIESEKIEPGENIVQFLNDDSPALNAIWKNEGYTIFSFLTPKEISHIKNSITDILKKYINNLGLNTDNFSLEQYHRYISSEQHLAIMDNIRAGSKGTGGIPFDLLPVSTKRLDTALSSVCNTNVTCTKTFDIGNGETYTVKHFFIRVVRPGLETDNNPPHKDTHIDRLRGAVNLYFPIAGSNINSSLPIIPSSHLWPESEIVRTSGNTLVNGSKYNVPAVVLAARGLNLITPNPDEDSAMVFTPYAIHGGGINFNTDITRVSLEIRFWKV